MKGEEGLYRIRVGDYRIIHQIQDAVLLVLGNRREIHRSQACSCPRPVSSPLPLTLTCRRYGRCGL